VIDKSTVLWLLQFTSRVKCFFIWFNVSISCVIV